MERTSRGRPKGSTTRGGRGKAKRGRKPKVVVSDTEESNEVETNPQEQEATNVEPEGIVAMEVDAPKPVEETPVEVKEVNALLAAEVGTFLTLNVSNFKTAAEPSPLEQPEPPSFTVSLQRNVPQVMVRLNWDHKVNLIGEKVLNPMIYCCDQCEKPILIYGRMIQCKHVFCLTCARTEAVLKQCPRCKEKVVRVEQTGLGTVFMCTHGGTRYDKNGCRRTYLSQRDLQAHINHRHVPIPAPQAQDIKSTEKSSLAATLVGVSPQPQQHPQNSHLRKVSLFDGRRALKAQLLAPEGTRPTNTSVYHF